MPHHTRKHSYHSYEKDVEDIEDSVRSRPKINPPKLFPVYGDRAKKSSSVEKNKEEQQVGDDEQLMVFGRKKAPKENRKRDVEVSSSFWMAEKDRWERQSIYKLPACVTTLNSKAYRPQVVSFGPYHFNDKDLKPMEEHKGRVVEHFLQRSGKPIEEYKTSIREVVMDLKDAYDSLMDDIGDRENNKDSDELFLELMIRDGIFMLEIIMFSTNTEDMSDYPQNDPIFSAHGRLQAIPYIKQDMLKIENQLPMLLLRKLLEVKYEKAQGEEPVNKLVFRFCFRDRKVPDKFIGKCNHVLDLYRKILLDQEQQPPPEPEILIDESLDEVMRPVTELREAGIKFRSSKTKCLKDISFDEGILTLPTITVDDTTEHLFLNLIAFERFHVGIGNEVSSYVVFMDNIIDSGKDIGILRSKKIVKNSYGSDEAAAELFNTLSKDVMMDQYGSLAKVHKKVNAYCNRRIPRWRAAFFITYCRNPWTGVSVLAAIVLFVLTITQTIYAVMDFYKPS